MFLFLSKHVTIAFSNFFCGLMGMTAPTHDIVVDWEQYYSVDSRTPLSALEGPFVDEEIRRAVFTLGGRG